MIDKDDEYGCATRDPRNIFDVIYTDINGVMWLQSAYGYSSTAKYRYDLSDVMVYRYIINI